MTQAESRDDYLSGLLGGHATAGLGGSAWLRDLRSRAVERANELSVPTTRDEEWRFTDLSALYRIPFRPVVQPVEVAHSQMDALMLPEADTRLVFIDGRFSAQFSSLVDGDGVTVANLADARPGLDATLKSHLGNLARIGADAFVAVNTAFLRDGAVVHISRDRQVAKPIHLLFVSASVDVATYPRTLVVAEAGSESLIVEDHVGTADGAYLANAVSEFVVGENATLSHIKLQRESNAAFHIARTAVKVGRAGRYSSWNMAFGGRISRSNVSIEQAGEGTDFSIDGLALVGGRQLADMHSSIDHAHAFGRSRQLHKTVAGGGSHAVFNGKILVREGAQRTDSGQQSRNLLLSDKAHVDTKPQLEIFADDVKCAHGATVGQIDADELFYLKSRGLSETAARNLLTYAFAAEVVERMPVKSLVERLEQRILEQTQTKETA